MTDRGTFVINGIERCVVNQLVRSPGMYFTGEVDPSTGRTLYSAEIRPMHGSWIEFLSREMTYLWFVSTDVVSLSQAHFCEP